MITLTSKFLYQEQSPGWINANFIDVLSC